MVDGREKARCLNNGSWGGGEGVLVFEFTFVRCGGRGWLKLKDQKTEEEGRLRREKWRGELASSQF